jgi:hypothetical protein
VFVDPTFSAAADARATCVGILVTEPEVTVKPCTAPCPDIAVVAAGPLVACDDSGVLGLPLPALARVAPTDGVPK